MHNWKLEIISHEFKEKLKSEQFSYCTVQAETESEAREKAMRECSISDKVNLKPKDTPIYNSSVWKDPKQSTCKKID
ncbi:hypothetical protein L3V86_00535 [Thiotrichales bacterium 19S11-10]|nr:hypothetical protein [Thiotrichales bacterium 19S11-10]